MVQAIKPRDVIPGKPQDPYAIQTVLGWDLIGVMSHVDQSQFQEEKGKNALSLNYNKGCHYPKCRFNVRGDHSSEGVLDPNEIIKIFEQDFSERKKDKPISQED